jgi:hypothetical protein
VISDGMQDVEILDDGHVLLDESNNTSPGKLLPGGQLMNAHHPFQSAAMSGI